MAVIKKTGMAGANVSKREASYPAGNQVNVRVWILSLRKEQRSAGGFIAIIQLGGLLCG